MDKTICQYCGNYTNDIKRSECCIKKLDELIYDCKGLKTKLKNIKTELKELKKESHKLRTNKYTKSQIRDNNIC